jgi:hypothetical protein
MLIDKSFSRVLVTIQLLIRQPSYQPNIDYGEKNPQKTKKRGKNQNSG